MQSFAQRQNYPGVDPYDKRYPRHDLFKIARKVLQYSWTIFAIYLVNAAWNLWTLLSPLPPFPGYKKLVNELIGAFVLPYPLNNPDLPFWIYGIVFLILVIGGVCWGSFWAKNDIEREKEVLEERRREKEFYNTPTVNLNAADVTQTLPTPIAHGPPFDMALLPLPEPFIGRTVEVQWLMRRLRANKINGIGNIAVLRGMAGIGKTGLAAKAVRDLRNEGRFRDGIAVYLCQGQTNASSVLQGVLARFDPLRRPPEFTTLNDLNDVLRRSLDGKDVLVVLDNVDPDLPIREIVTPLRGAGVSVLLIAQHTFSHSAIPPDASYLVEHLPALEARDLFMRQGGVSRSSTPLPILKIDTIDSIVEALKYHTLTLKIVGAYARDRDIETLNHEIATNPGSIFSLSDGELPRVIEVALNNSVDLLPGNAQRFFTALAAFATIEFGRGAALQLAADLGLGSSMEGNLVDLLVRRALLETSRMDTLPLGKDRERLRLHPLLRALALNKFESWTPKERREAYRSVASYYARYTEDTADEVLSADEGNIAGALEWASTNGQKALVMTICANMRYFWYHCWRMATSQHYLPLGVDAANTIAQTTNRLDHHKIAATLELTYARVLQRLGRVTDAEETLKRNLAKRVTLLDKRGEAEVHASLGRLAQQRGLLREAGDHFDESLNLFREVHHRKGEGLILGYIGELSWRLGRLEEAQNYCLQSLSILREEQDQRNLVQTLVRLGEIAQDRRQINKAGEYYQEALALAQSIQDRQGEGLVRRCIGNLAFLRNQSNEAMDFYQRALIIATEVRDRQSEGWVMESFGEIAQSSGDHSEAEHYYQKGLEIAREMHDRRAESKSLMNLGRLAQTLRQLDSAERYYNEALAIARDMEDSIHYATLAFTFGSFLVSVRGKQGDGCRLLRDAEQLYTGIGLPGADEVRRIARRYECLS